jgi:fructose-specific phosphotransferase system IIC component
LIVLPVVEHRLWYLGAIAIGTLAVAVTINLLRAPARSAQPSAEAP